MQLIFILSLLYTILAQDARTQAEYNCRNACSVLQETGIVGQCVVQCIQIYNFNNPNAPITLPLPENNQGKSSSPSPTPTPTTDNKDATPIGTVTSTVALDSSPSSQASSPSPPPPPPPPPPSSQNSIMVTTIVDVPTQSSNNSNNFNNSYPTLNGSASKANSISQSTGSANNDKAPSTKKSATVPTTLYSFSHTKTSNAGSLSSYSLVSLVLISLVTFF